MRPLFRQPMSMRLLSRLLLLLAVVLAVGAAPVRARAGEPGAEGTGDGGAVVAPSVPAPTTAPVPSGAAASGPADGAAGAVETGAGPSCPNCRKGRPGGVNPCNTPDPGWGIYDKWSGAPSIGQMIAPGSGGLTRDGGFDLIVHFHGHEPIRKEFVKTAKGIVLVGVDLGIGSGAYASAFASPVVFERLLASVEREMARRSGREKAHVRKLALSSWSAGYGALEQILRQPLGKKVDALILLDSLHTGYVEGSQKTLVTAGLDPFVAFARKAAAGSKLMFQSYSSIEPPGYASTREVAHYVIGQLGGKPVRAKRSDVLGLEMFERYDRGNYHARGYTGDDKPDHCAHIGLMKDVVRVHLARRWNTPTGKGKLGTKPKDGKPPRALPPGAKIHVVASGQSLGRIAKRYNVTVDAIREANDLGGGRRIQPGDELVIPLAPTKAKADKADAPKRPARAGEVVHEVKEQESLWGIAKRYNTTVAAIAERNGFPEDKPIQPGQELIIPRTAPAAK